MTQPVIDLKLLEFATERQKDYIAAVNKHGTRAKAASVLGVHHSVLNRSLQALERRAAVQGYSPVHDMLHPAPKGFAVKGTTTLYDDEEKKRLQWVRTNRDDSQAEEVIREFIDELTRGVKGTSPIVKAPKFVEKDLLAVYPMGDPHMGLLAMAAECGDDFRLEDCEALNRAAFDRLVGSAVAAETALIAELGDFFHADDESNRTKRSGAALDTSHRWPEVMQAGIRLMKYAIEKCLEKHKRVIVRIVRGNHDFNSSYALALALACFYENNPRVEIVTDPGAYWYFEFGKVLIGLTHGDTSKPGDLGGIMSVDRAEAWGRTKHRYWLQGHIHHRSQKEYYGVLVESFRTLAGKDDWHTREGYRSGRDMHCIIHHREHGEIQRTRVDVGILLDDLKKKAA